MCGICGIFNLEASRPVKESSLREMVEVLRHRGPDDEGYYIDSDHNIGFGHCRLSIIDISGSRQPMSNENGTIWLAYNGEVYNYLELRTPLLSKGHRFATHGDTEVVIHLYEELGEECVHRLNGMFAFAIWDKPRKKLFLARDRFGIKPLYYTFDGNRFVFASEIKAILREGSVRAEFNSEALLDYVHFQFCLGDRTFFRGVKKLLPGHVLSLDLESGILQVKKYWDIPYEDIDLEHDEDYFADRILLLLENAVRLRLRSDVPLGTHLSGGLDSSTIVCLASLLSNNSLHTFTGAFHEGQDYDETFYADLVSKHIGAIKHLIYSTWQDFADIFPSLIYFLDEPVAGPGVFPQYYVSKLASENVKVVLGGQGGDEIFGGYTRYVVAYLEECLKHAILPDPEQRLPHSDKFVVTLNALIPNLTQLQGYLPLLQYFWQDGLFGPADERYFRLIDRSEQTKEILNADIYHQVGNYSGFEAFREQFNRPGVRSLINKMSYFDVKTLLPALLQVEDRMSMAVSLESRVPILDYRIIEFYSRIPPTIKFKGGQSKYIFRKAVRNVLPPQILDRMDKKGFPVPLTEWFQGPLRDYMHDILLSKTARERGIFNMDAVSRLLSTERKFGRQLWGLLCLEMWFRTFIDGRSSVYNSR